MMERLLRTIAAELDVPRERLDEVTTRDDLESWDSLGHLNVILAVEAAFGVRFGPTRIPELTSVRAIAEELELELERELE